MHFSFVLTVFFLLLSTIVRDEGVSLADDICNAYLHSNSFIDNSTRISFSKTPALTLSCLGLCTQNTLYKKCGHNPSLKPGSFLGRGPKTSAIFNRAKSCKRGKHHIIYNDIDEHLFYFGDMHRLKKIM